MRQVPGYAASMESDLFMLTFVSHLNTLRPRQNGRHFPDDIFKCIFLNENIWISIKIPLKFVPKGPINNIPALFRIMVWRRPGDKPLSETMTVTLVTHICVTRPQWVKNGENWNNMINSVGAGIKFKFKVFKWTLLTIPSGQHIRHR